MKKIHLKYISYLSALLIMVAVSCWMWQHLGCNKSYKNVAVYLSAEALFNDYATDPEQWSNKYLFNYIEVDGTIEEVTKKKNDQIKLVLKGNNHYYGVECTIIHAKKQVRTPLKLGSKITIQGFCFGKKQNVMMAGCFIVKRNGSMLFW